MKLGWSIIFFGLRFILSIKKAKTPQQRDTMLKESLLSFLLNDDNGCKNYIYMLFIGRCILTIIILVLFRIFILRGVH